MGRSRDGRPLHVADDPKAISSVQQVKRWPLSWPFLISRRVAGIFQTQTPTFVWSSRFSWNMRKIGRFPEPISAKNPFVPCCPKQPNSWVEYLEIANMPWQYQDDSTKFAETLINQHSSPIQKDADLVLRLTPFHDNADIFDLGGCTLNEVSCKDAPAMIYGALCRNALGRLCFFSSYSN